VSRHRLAAVAIGLAAAALAGCGNSRTPAPRVAPPSAPAGRAAVDFPSLGVGFRRPANWALAKGALPQLAVVGSGRAAIVVWRYPRSEPLPRTADDLDRARRALIAAARARDGSLRVISSRTVDVRGARGVEVVADERLGSARRQVRSTHLYAQGAELVLDAFAPPAEFARVDRTVFRPLVRSVRVTKPTS
jgi:hypothetical protein